MRGRLGACIAIPIFFTALSGCSSEVAQPTPDVPATVAAAVHATLTTTPIPTPKPTPWLSPIPPLQITIRSITADRVLSVRLTNVSDKVIRAYELLICPMDSSGEPLQKWGEECFEKSYRYERLRPVGGIPPARYELLDENRPGVYGILKIPVEHELWSTDDYLDFDLQRFETAANVTVELVSVIFEDGISWKGGILFPA